MAGEMREMVERPIGRAIMEADTAQFRELLKADEEDVHFKDRKGNTYFHLLATTHRPYIFHVLVATGLNINAQNRDGNTALHVTALHDEIGHLTDLMACGADPTIQNKSGKTAEDINTHNKYWHDLYEKYKPGLREAIRAHDVSRVEYLLNCWCSVEVVIYGKDMRQYAAALTYHDIVSLIDQHRFSIMAVYGVLECNYKKLRYALTRPECDVNFLQRADGAHVHHMLQHAIRQGKRRLVAMLVEAGSDVTTFVRLSEYMRGPLYFETLRSDVDRQITDILLSASPDLNAKDEKGRSALVYVLDRTEGDTTLRLTEKLLDMGIDIALRDNTGCTARDVALFYRRQDIVGAIDKHLVAFVKDSNVPRIRQLAMNCYHDIFIDYQHRDTLIYAAGNETEEMTDFLLTLTDCWELCTRLQQHVVAGNQSAIEQILQEARDPEMLLLYRDKGGRTLLMTAIIYGHVTLTRWLLRQHPALVDCTDNNYRTALHYAYGRRDNTRYSFIEMLTESGAGLDRKDVTGSRPEHPSISDTTWLEEEKQAIYGLELQRHCIEKYEDLLSIIRSRSKTVKDFDLVLKGLRCPVSRLPNVFCPENKQLVPHYRDLLLAAVDHGKDDIGRKLVQLGIDCNVTEKYISKSGDSQVLTGEERARLLGHDELADYIRTNSRHQMES